MVIPSRMKNMRKGFEDLHDKVLGVMTDGVLLSFLVGILWMRSPGHAFVDGPLLKAAKMRLEALAVSSCSSQAILARSNRLPPDSRQEPVIWMMRIPSRPPPFAGMGWNS